MAGGSGLEMQWIRKKVDCETLDGWSIAHWFVASLYSRIKAKVVYWFHITPWSIVCLEG